MGVWIPAVRPTDDEVLRMQGLANHLRGRRSIRGRLTLTDQRLVFVPTRLAALLGARRIDLPLRTVASVDTLQPGRGAIRQRGPSAAIRPQVAITGARDLYVFTMRNPSELTRLLRTS